VTPPGPSDYFGAFQEFVPINDKVLKFAFERLAKEADKRYSETGCLALEVKP
jgi:hypothetical protein